MREHRKAEGPGSPRAPRNPGVRGWVLGPSPASLLADVRDTFLKLQGWHHESFGARPWRLSVNREKSAEEIWAGSARAGKAYLSVLPVAFLGLRSARKRAFTSTADLCGLPQDRLPAQAVGQPSRPYNPIGHPIVKSLQFTALRGVASQDHVARLDSLPRDLFPHGHRGEIAGKKLRARARVEDLVSCKSTYMGRVSPETASWRPRLPGKSRKALEWKVEG